MKRVLVIISAAMNVVLLGLLVAGSPGDRPESGRNRAELGRAATHGEALSAEPEQLHDTLLELGLGDRMAKRLVLAELLDAAVDSDANADRYWEQTPATRYRQALELIDAHDLARRKIVDIYGPDAKSDPAFRALFRPLEARFPFMSSEEQLATERLQLEFQLERAMAGPDERRAGENATSVSVYERFVSVLTGLIGPESALEYALRESPLAMQLRLSGAVFDETGYRESFRILRELDRGEAPRDQFLAARRRLRGLLGEQSFTRLWATRDPRFAIVRRTGKRENLSDDQIISAYRILNDGQDALLEALATHAEDPERRTAITRDFQARQHRRLSELVGETTADRIQNALARQALVPPGRPPEEAPSPTFRQFP